MSLLAYGYWRLLNEIPLGLFREFGAFPRAPELCFAVGGKTEQ